MPGFVICAGVNGHLTQADIETELCDILGTGSNTDDASDEDVIEDPAQNVEPLHHVSDNCSEERRPAF
jgi:hypothetical protein